MNAKEKTLKRFIAYLESGKSIIYSDIKREDSSLLYAIERHYGGIFKISQEIGIDEEELVNVYGLSRNINKRTLTEDEIRTRLLYLKSIGKLTTSAMRTEFEDLRLEQSIKKKYGSVKNGLLHFNLLSDRVRVSKNSLSKEILEASKRGDDMSYTAMLENNSKLLNNTVNVFGMGWYKVLDSLDVSYEALRKRFTETSIAERIEAVRGKAGTVNYRTLQMFDASILFYAYDQFESLIDFYVAFGLNPDECMDFSKQTIKGFAFEKVFAKLLDIMQIDYTFNKQFCEGIRPDFQLNNNIWIDCKLSAWTKSIEDTVERYTPLCNKLVIVFLRGEYKHLPELDNAKLEYRKVDYYYPFLRQINRQDLIEEFENIKNNDEFLESVTTERLIS